uniref:coiled-coil domain-containing protein 42 homolog n=1 Tax=Podarcis muralis TaxID=64176 RepID=UPI00109F8BB6|nr:coiled-coil domain-containing protein 42 homolog [Podarcis muralis]
MTFLMMTRDNDPKYFLQVDNGPGNIFVTQLGEHRQEEGEDVPQIPVMRESTSDILQHRRKALQTFRLRKKEIENEQASAELTAKKQEFKERMEALVQRREALEQKDQDRKNRILEFDEYIKECHQKKERVIQLYHQEHALKALKKREVFKLKKELKKLQVRKKELQKKMAKYKSFEDFLKKVTATFTPGFLGYPEDSMVEALVKRHKTLFEENQSLMKNLSIQQCHIEETQKELGILREEYNTTTFVLLGKISELQSKKSALQEKKKHLCHHINNEECLIDQKRQDLSRMMLAINNMAELCYMPHYGPLDDMTLRSKLDMIQESILRKKQIVEETKALQSEELTRSSSNLFREKSSSTLSRELKKQISFVSKDKLEDKGGKA